jgi:hypothetical protein
VVGVNGDVEFSHLRIVTICSQCYIMLYPWYERTLQLVQWEVSV